MYGSPTQAGTLRRRSWSPTKWRWIRSCWTRWRTSSGIWTCHRLRYVYVTFTFCHPLWKAGEIYNGICQAACFLLACWRSMTKIAGSGSGSISQKHGSEDPDPDPPQNVLDREHWYKHNAFNRFLSFFLIYGRYGKRYLILRYITIHKLNFKCPLIKHREINTSRPGIELRPSR